MISLAKQDGNAINVYDENGNHKFTRYGDELVGFTGTTVSIRDRNVIKVYDENGNYKFAKYI